MKFKRRSEREMNGYFMKFERRSGAEREIKKGIVNHFMRPNGESDERKSLSIVSP